MTQFEQLDMKKDLRKLKSKDKILMKYKNGFMYLLKVVRLDEKYVACITPNKNCIQETYISIDGKYGDYVEYIVKVE